MMVGIDVIRANILYALNSIEEGIVTANKLLSIPSAAYSGMTPLEKPLVFRGTVVHGFGRGSKQLGIPTANLDAQSLSAVIDDLPAGIYFGWASIGSDKDIYKMVMSIGW